MNNYFEREIRQLKKELLQLKTSSQKSAGLVPIISRTANVSIPLSLNSIQTECSGEIIYLIEPNSDALIIPTLDKYYDDIMLNDRLPYRTRKVSLALTVGTDGRYLLRITGRGDTNDVSSLVGGGSVNLNTILTVQCSDNFTMRML